MNDQNFFYDFDNFRQFTTTFVLANVVYSIFFFQSKTLKEVVGGKELL